MRPEQRYSLAELERYAASLSLAAGAGPEQAETLAQALVWCDACGRSEQGLWRLPLFASRIMAGGIDGKAQPTLEHSAGAVVHVDGRNGCGHHVARFAMHAACQKARESGVAIALVANSNHYGAGGYFVWQAAQAGMLGFAFSNAYPKVALPGGTRAVLGTNPFSFAAPVAGGEHVLVDFSTAAASGSSVERARAAGEALPEGVVQGDAGLVFEPAAGGKGSGLALMIELLSGALAGGAVASQLGSVYGDPRNAGRIGHCLIALDPGAGHSAWSGLTAELLTEYQAGATDARYPGQLRSRLLRESRRDGLLVDAGTCSALEDLARKLGVAQSPG